MSVGGRSQSFGPANIDTSLTNTADTAYLIQSGNTANSLTLTNPGSSGRFTYQYVGAAIWQNTVVNGGYGSGTMYALTYGYPTLAAAVPVVGTAQYGIDVLGALATGDTVTGMTGQGTLAINFVSGSLLMTGAITASGGSEGGFKGSGTLNSTGGFSGGLFFDFLSQVSNIQSGQMAGHLYGPSAQEVGGSFYASANTAAGSIGQPEIVLGTFLGRLTPPSAAATTFSGLSGAQYFTADRANQTGSGSGSLGSASVSVLTGGTTDTISVTTPAITITVFPAHGQLIGPSSLLGSPSTMTDAVNPSFTGENLLFLSSTAPDQYVRGAVLYNKSASPYTFDDLTFGFNTPVSAVPTTGFAGYTVAVDGTMANSKASSSAATEINGAGTIGVAFATGVVTLSGTLANGSPGSALATPLGSFTGTGKLGSAANTLAGTLSVTGATAYAGSWKGSLYGPAANEVGAVFTANGADGSNITGVMTGGQNANIVNPVTTLLTLTGTTSFSTDLSAYAFVRTVSPPGQTESGAGAAFTYDATAKTYTYNGGTNNFTFFTPLNVVLSPANIDTKNSTTTFAAYATPTVTARIFNSGVNNPTLQLSYVSFADIMQTGPNAFTQSTYPVDNFLTFGLTTTATSVPTTGSASYSGVVFGRGYYPALADGDVAIGGTGQMSVNFSAGTANTALTLNAKPAAGGTQQSIGTVNYNAWLSGASITGNVSNANMVGSINGSLYGPKADEVGATFSLYMFSNNANGPAYLAGAFLGKKN